jgi:hypothetical protein
MYALRNVGLAVVVALLTTVGFAGSSPYERHPAAVEKIKDRAAFIARLHAMGHKAKGGISKSMTDRNDERLRSFPHFTSSFKVNGQTFPYTMVGYPPSSGRTARIRPVIVPLRMNFIFFDQPASFDPAPAVDNIVKSPMFQNARFPNGVGQFGDMLQRATFWNKMDDRRKWHVLMEEPRVLPTIDVPVEPDVGELLQLGSTPDTVIGNLRFGAMDAIIHTILQFIPIEPDELPIFVTYNVFADALGYHDAFPVGENDGTTVLQTLIYTSWLEGSVVGDLLADVSTLNHELGEWLNDPYVNNVVPTWTYPPSNVDCSGNNLLEVGDPQGNGPEFFLFPTVVIPLRGFNYHLQDLVMVPWFADERPSSAQNGWYDFPDTHQITTPAVYCAP